MFYYSTGKQLERAAKQKQGEEICIRCINGSWIVYSRPTALNELDLKNVKTAGLVQINLSDAVNRFMEQFEEKKPKQQKKGCCGG